MQRWLSAVCKDDGMALATVVAISAIMFLLATTLVMLSTQQQIAGSNQLQRTKALHVADAGVNAYLYELSRDKTYQTALASTTADGSWSVTAEPPGSGSAVTRLTAVGTVSAVGNAPGVTRTVKATVRPGSFSDYMFLMNTEFRLGVNGLVKGNVRSNSYVNNDGTITGDVFANTTITGNGVFGGGQTPYYKKQSFAVIDYGLLQSLAMTDGTYYPDSGTFGTGSSKRHYLGYSLNFSGLGGTVAKVQSIDTVTGAMVTDAAVPFTTPANGVLYFDDPVWVGGTYGAKVTIAVGKDLGDGDGDPGPSGMNPASLLGPWPNNTNSSVFIWKNLVSSNPANADIVCGIVTKGDISITSEYPNPPTPTDMTIRAAMLSSMGSIHADFGNNRLKNHLRIIGAEAAWEYSFITRYNYWGTPILGFNTRDYWYDPNLDVTTPPNFPPLGDGKLWVRTWVEN
jgi:hypothetical protein